MRYRAPGCRMYNVKSLSLYWAETHNLGEGLSNLSKSMKAETSCLLICMPFVSLEVRFTSLRNTVVFYIW